MAKLRFNRTFKNAMWVIAFCILLFGGTVVFSVVAKIQYDAFVADMESVVATIVDIDLDMHVKGPSEQEIYVIYEVDGVTYNRELKTDTPISFAPGTGTNFSEGDRIRIFYDPHDPETIASSLSVRVGYFYMNLGVAGLALMLFTLGYMLRHTDRFLVTQKEYEKEEENLRKIKLEEKRQREQQEAERQKKYAKVNAISNKICKVILIIWAVLFGAFLLFVLFGLLLKAFGY